MANLTFLHNAPKVSNAPNRFSQKRTLQSDVQPVLKKPKTTHANTDAMVSRPLKKNDVVDANMRGSTKTTISTANILNRLPMKQVHPSKVAFGRRRRQRAEPEHDLFLDYQEDLEAYRNTLQSKSTIKLEKSQEELTKRLSEVQLRDKEALSDIATKKEKALSTLNNEVVETSFMRNGKQVIEVITIVERVQDLKALVLKSEKDLKELWKDWEVVQRQIRELGEQVMGSDSNEGYDEDDGDELELNDNIGYATHVATWDEQLRREVSDLIKEAENAGAEAKKKMAAAEKEFEASLVKQQASLLNRLFTED